MFACNVPSNLARAYGIMTIIIAGVVVVVVAVGEFIMDAVVLFNIINNANAA